MTAKTMYIITCIGIALLIPIGYVLDTDSKDKKFITGLLACTEAILASGYFIATW